MKKFNNAFSLLLNDETRSFGVFQLLLQGYKEQELQEYFLTHPHFWNWKVIDQYRHERVFKIDENWTFCFQTIHHLLHFQKPYRHCEVRLKYKNFPCAEIGMNAIRGYSVWHGYDYTCDTKNVYREYLKPLYRGRKIKRCTRNFMFLFFDSFFDSCKREFI